LAPWLICETLLGAAQVDVLAAALQEVSCTRVRTLNLWQGGLPESAALTLTKPLTAQRVPVKLCGALLDAPHLTVSGKGLTPADAVLIANDLVQVRCTPTGTSLAERIIEAF